MFLIHRAAMLGAAASLLTLSPTAVSAPQFPIDGSLDTCFREAPDLIACMVMPLRLEDDGSARTPGEAFGSWRWENGRFFLELGYDTDNDGIPEITHSYRGELGGGDLCMTGEVYEHATDEEGRFWFCI